jgi:hypothetical protein
MRTIMIKQIKRNNAIFEIAAKKGAEMSRKKQFASATKMMEKIGLPENVIDRVLYEPHNIRSTDLSD